MNKQVDTFFPKRMHWVLKLRQVTDYWLTLIPWPNLNPTIVSILSLLAALGFAWAYLEGLVWIALVLLIINMLGDWIDGAIAKRHNRTSFKGWVIDNVVDRASEGIILIQFMEPWFSMFVINCFMAFYSYAFRCNIIIPLRIIFLVYYLIIIFI